MATRLTSDRSRRRRRLRATVVAAGGRGARRAGRRWRSRRCRRRPGERRPRRRDQQGAQRQRRGPDQRGRRRRRADRRRQAGGAVGGLPPAETAGRRPGVRRSFAGGAWTTRGIGTVGGRSSAGPTFTGSLNFDQGQDGEAPAIDFAGAGRTVPWATWYENTTGTGFGNNNVFASRFDNTGDANQGKWIFAGQGRGTGGGSVPVPSLNIHTDQERREPVGGRRLGGRPDQARAVGHLAGDDHAPVSGKDQIFVVAADRPGHGQLRRRQAGGRGRRRRPRARDRRLLLAADRHPARRPGRRGPEPERRPDARRRRARHRVHRRRTTACRGSSGTRQDRRRCTGPARTTRWCSPPRASATASPRTAASTGSRSASQLQRRRSTRAARTASARARIRGRRAGSAR